MAPPRNWLPLLILFGIILIVVSIFYHEPLLAPNQTFMGGGNDGLKNYYTPWYHAKYDSSYTHFQGMNYPYGDHVVFADAQPLLSNTIKLLGLADWTVGIMNYVLILGIFLSGWLLYRILLRWGVEAWWAAISAAAVTMLSPQLIKMNGHYALAYVFAIPLVWHLVMRFFEKPGILRSLALALPIFLLGWLHPYYVMISAVFLTAFWLFHSLVAWRSLTFWQKALHFGLQVILPVALFTLSLKLTDSVTDRPANPYGIDEYISSWRTIFLPIALKVLEVIPKSLYKGNPNEWEGIGFIGFVAVLIFIGFWLRTIFKLGWAVLQRRTQGFQFLPAGELPEGTRKIIVASVLAGVAVGIFACGFPFAIKPERLTELFPPIKQFRSLGRFNWAFYYTWVTFSFFLVGHAIQWLRRKNRRVLAIALAVVVAGWTLFEGGALNEGVRIRIWVVKLMTYLKGEPGMIPGQDVSPWMASIRPEKYSAILALPYFHEGSENFRACKPIAAKFAFEASIRTGLPMMDVMMSRTSFSQSWGAIQLITEPATPLQLLDDFHDPKPILAMRFGDSPDFDGPYMQQFGSAIYHQDSLTFYEIDLRALQERLLAHRDTLPDSLWDGPSGLKCSSPRCGVVWDDFDAQSDGPGYRSTSGKTVLLKDNNLIHQGPLDVSPNDTIVVSLWLKLKGDQLPFTQMGYEEGAGTDQAVWDYLSLHNQIKRIDGDWALCEREFVVKNPTGNIVLNITRWKRLPPKVTIDNLLIRKKGTDVYKFENGEPIWKNNRHLPWAASQ